MNPLRIFRRDKKASNTETRNAGSVYHELIIDGRPYSRATEFYNGAMSIPAVWRGANLIADLLASLPAKAHREGANGVDEVVPSLLLDQPSPPEPRVTTITSLMLDLIMNGNAIAVIASRDARGIPTSIVPVPAAQVVVWREGKTGEVFYEINGQRFDAFDVMHIKGPSAPGALRGMGIIEVHTCSLNLSHDLQAQAGNVSGYNVPTGVLKSENPDLTQEDVNEMKRLWALSQQKRSVAVLTAGTTYEPLAWNPEEAQLLEARQFSLKEVALMFGLPLSFLGAEDSSRTYSNTQLEALNLVKFALAGYIARLEAGLSSLMPPGVFVKLNLDALLRADTKTRYEAHEIALRAGFLTVNEVRALEDLPPIPEPREEQSADATEEAQADDDNADRNNDDEDARV